ncbi:MAG: hypothetical protein AAFN10_06585 [Bacteroidota bacterium]
MRDQKVNGTYVLVIFAVILGTWLVHEFAHWTMGEVLGHDSTMRLNGTSYLEPQNVSDSERSLVSAAGPIITIIQGLIIFLILRRQQWNKYLYSILFSAFFMRFLAGLMNFIKANDEGRISIFLGLGLFSLPILVAGLLFYWVYQTSKRHELGWRFQLGTSLWVLLASSLLIMADQFFKIQLI